MYLVTHHSLTSNNQTRNTRNTASISLLARPGNGLLIEDLLYFEYYKNGRQQTIGKTSDGI